VYTPSEAAKSVTRQMQKSAGIVENYNPKKEVSDEKRTVRNDDQKQKIEPKV
jgi:hypothetical protein